MKINIKSFARVALGYARENTPLIMTGTAIGGVVTTTVLAAKAGREAEKVYEEAENKEIPKDRVAAALQYAKITWKVWVPTVVSGVLTIGSVVMIHYTHQKRYAALMGLYALGNQAFQEYRESVDEVVDEKTVAKVKEKVSQKAESRAGGAFQNQLIENPDSTIIYDGFSGRSFVDDLESVRAAVNDFNQNLIHHTYGSLNELYSLLGWEGIAAGEDVGWSSDELLSVSFNPWLTAQNKPAIHFSFDNRPFHNYYKNF